MKQRQRLFIAYGLSTAAQFAADVIPVMVLIAANASTLMIAAVVMTRLVVITLAAPLGGVIAGRLDASTTMRAADVTRAAILLAAVAAVQAHAPTWITLIWAAAVALAGTPHRPAAVVLFHRLIDASEVASVNRVLAVTASTMMFVGPAVAAALVWLGGPTVGVLGVAVLFAAAAVLERVKGRMTPTFNEPISRVGRMVVDDLRNGVRLVRRDLALAPVFGIIGVVMAQLGAEQVLYPVFAHDTLRLGSSGLGLLAAAQGFGGMLTLPWLRRELSGSRAAWTLLTAALAMALAFMALGFSDHLGLVLLLLVGSGAGNMLYEATLLVVLRQRATTRELASLLGLGEAVNALAALLGVVVVPSLVHAWGVTNTLSALGVIAVALLGALAIPIRRGARAIAREDRDLEPIMTILGHTGFTKGLGHDGLRAVARSAVPQDVFSGEAVFLEGDAPEHFYFVRNGMLDVSTRVDGVVNRLGPEDWFGEIGLLKNTPRTATVRATTDASLLVIPGSVFMQSMREAHALPDTLTATMTGRLLLTHPWLLD